MRRRVIAVLPVLSAVIALVMPLARADAQITRITDRSQMAANGSITWDQLTSASHPNGNLPDNFVTMETVGLSTGITGLTGDIRLAENQAQVFTMYTAGVSFFNTDFALGTRLLLPSYLQAFSPLVVTLSADVGAIGMVVDGDVGATSMRAVAFDATGAVLDDFSLIDDPDAPSFMGFRSATANIRRIELYRAFFYVPYTSGLYIESGVVAPPPMSVPEPSSLALVGLGALLLTASATRRPRRLH